MSEVYLVDGIRTPIGRYGGALSSVRADDLGAVPIAALLARHPQLDPAAIDDVYLGCANQAGEDNRNVARMSVLLAGLPSSVPGSTVNRLCGSGLEAVGIAARGIRAGELELAVAGGVESMSRAPWVMGKAESAFARNQHLHDTTMGWRFINPRLEATYGVELMGETAENVAQRYAISRDDQDAFALRSQQRTAAAQAAGFFDDEITAVAVAGRKGGEGVQVMRDEHPRADASAEALARLKPVFRQPGTVTAGNAAGLNDGAASLLLASARALHLHGLTPRARVLGFASAGVEPTYMGIGPIPATQRLLARLGLQIAQFDAIEFNEAFAAQALACTRAFGLADDAAHVNANGGAIALGHPLGMSGARLALTLLRQLDACNGRRGLASMCIGVGQGVALAIERV
ncbi:3-oxoadipyl-CoA thiolase [Xanthomonas campestris pv. raphani]|jgi:3-oxoadipyl-CoA thiolase|uniref:3-oxoadipyl-CoA thiolase n=1 Tax=Xanthomonas campestris TaxID=339 RepID=UPI0005E358A1|nr:3-oxoadipyl-CoA thiolase [Xanthomonas campestris]AKS14784.1 beta-ketoadipyl CoA thiolase [Xanthomonas campestris pv. campestris]MCC5046903.1 3-oxoadipyl-CoA thiolase [Xanthomonas campestris]MCC5053514.1 3-oxoadipyl-CoA thiolase [Xanthomonas campestris pv. aberrans]MCC5055207.1 3-oxoadipyl-CoA thiolase [Xanthomonas campestris]MCC5059090.1 3-oxoadipyl-CoA thiolase [Xanthomonas campestris]